MSLTTVKHHLFAKGPFVRILAMDVAGNVKYTIMERVDIDYMLVSEYTSGKRVDMPTYLGKSDTRAVINKPADTYQCDFSEGEEMIVGEKVIITRILGGDFEVTDAHNATYKISGDTPLEELISLAYPSGTWKSSQQA